MTHTFSKSKGSAELGIRVVRHGGDVEDVAPNAVEDEPGASLALHRLACPGCGGWWLEPASQSRPMMFCPLCGLSATPKE